MITKIRSKKSNKQFKEYFEANWDNCQEMWVTYKRDHHVH